MLVKCPSVQRQSDGLTIHTQNVFPRSWIPRSTSHLSGEVFRDGQLRMIIIIIIILIILIITIIIIMLIIIILILIIVINIITLTDNDTNDNDYDNDNDMFNNANTHATDNTSKVFRDGQLLKTACGSPCYAPPEMVVRDRQARKRDNMGSALLGSLRISCLLTEGLFGYSR